MPTWTPGPDPTFDATKKKLSVGLGDRPMGSDTPDPVSGVSGSYAPNPENAGRTSFGISQGDQDRPRRR